METGVPRDITRPHKAPSDHFTIHINSATAATPLPLTEQLRSTNTKIHRKGGKKVAASSAGIRSFNNSRASAPLQQLSFLRESNNSASDDVVMSEKLVQSISKLKMINKSYRI